jgi:hypothetical protein
MQRTHEGNKLITPAAYARLRGLNRSTISRQIRTGSIPTHDGLVNPGEADHSRENNLDASKRRNKPEPNLDFMSGLNLADSLAGLKNPEPDKQRLQALLDYALAIGMRRLAEGLRDPVRFESLQSIAVESAGINPEQAFKAARGFVFLAHIWIKDILAHNINKKTAKEFEQNLTYWVCSGADKPKQKPTMAGKS